MSEINKRKFIKTTAAATAGLWAALNLGYNSFAADNKKIKVISYMTGITALQWLYKEAGINADVGTAQARKALTVDFGEKTPRKFYVGSNTKDVVLSDQIAWTTNADQAKVYKHKGMITRTPKSIDFIFPGDYLVVNLDALPTEHGEKISKRFSGGMIDVSEDQFSAFVSGHEKYKKLIEQQAEAIGRLKTDDPRRVQRYLKMAKERPHEFISRLVSSGLDDKDGGMYEVIGVATWSPTKYVAKKGDTLGNNDGGLAVEQPEHKTNPLTPQNYLGIVFIRPDNVVNASDGLLKKIGNLGITEYEEKLKNHYDAQMQMPDESIKKEIGKDRWAELLKEAVPERKFVPTGGKDGYKYFATLAFNRHGGVSEKQYEQFQRLAEKATILDRLTGAGTIDLKLSSQEEVGSVVEAVKAFKEQGYKLKGYALQRVEPQKQL